MIRIKLRQLGQGLSEYIIIVALIAIAAIAIYGLFGDTVRGQLGVTSEDLAGQPGGDSVQGADTSPASETRGLNKFSEGTVK